MQSFKIHQTVHESSLIYLLTTSFDERERERERKGAPE